MNKPSCFGQYSRTAEARCMRMCPDIKERVECSRTNPFHILMDRINKLEERLEEMISNFKKHEDGEEYYWS